MDDCCDWSLASLDFAPSPTCFALWSIKTRLTFHYTLTQSES